MTPQARNETCEHAERVECGQSTDDVARFGETMSQSVAERFISLRAGGMRAGANACGARPVVRAEHGIVRGGASFGRKCRAEKESRRIRNDTGLQQHMKRAGAEHGPAYLCGRRSCSFEVDSSCISGACSGNGSGETNIKEARRKDIDSGRARRAARGKTRRRRAHHGATRKRQVACRMPRTALRRWA